ncbi:MAG TPA: flotillin domain-containing protein, partial [Candidatus Dormibacteraeota bacterium]
EARGLAEAAAIKARAEALAVNQEAVIAQQLAEQAVNIVAAAAKPVGDIDNLVVLNGTDGIQEAVFGSIAKGFTALQALRTSLAPGTVSPTAEQNGHADGAPEEPPIPGRIRRGGSDGTA